MDLHLLIRVLGFLNLAGGFLDHAYAGDSSDSQNIAKASGTLNSGLRNDICYFPLLEVGPENYPLNKTVGCDQCKVAIPKGVPIILQHCCACCFYDGNPRNGSVFLSNSDDNKPTFKVIHSCDKDPQMYMTSGNVTLDGESIKGVEKSGTCSTTYMPKEPLDEKYNGSSIKFQILTENCKDSEEIIFIFNPTKSNGISVGSAVGIAFGVLGGGIVALSIVLFIMYKLRRSGTPIVANGHPGQDVERGLNFNGGETIELKHLQNGNGAVGQNGHLQDQSQSEKTANGHGGVPTGKSSA